MQDFQCYRLTKNEAYTMGIGYDAITMQNWWSFVSKLIQIIIWKQNEIKFLC